MHAAAADHKRTLRVTAGNLRNAHLYVSGHLDFFPPDIVGPSKLDGPLNGRAIRIHLDGLDETIETDIPTDPRTGKPRSNFRQRAWVRRFFKHHGVKAEDSIMIERRGHREYCLIAAHAQNSRRTAGTLRGHRSEHSFSEHLAYPAHLDRILYLRRPSRKWPLALDLFAGCGGLGLGFESAGFRTVGLERDPDACATYRANLHGRCIETVLSPDTEVDLSPDLVIGGPPCQPFSVGGLQEGKRDDRDGFPTFLQIVHRCAPRLVIFENVRGMLYQNKRYLQHVRDEFHAMGFRTSCRLLNAVHYGVPQRRERLFVVAHHGGWRWPVPVARSFTAGDALGDTATLVLPGSRFLTPSMDAYVARYEKASKCIQPRDLHLDRPSRTVTCRNLNGATGDMLRIRLPGGRRRRLVPREGARLQGFPDWFEFSGSDGSQFNQIGNAVPPPLARAVAACAADYFRHLEQGDLDVNEPEAPQLEFQYA